MKSLKSKLWRRVEDEDGNSTIEFVFVFPVFMILFLSVMEMGLLMTRYMMFERGIDIVVREMRLRSTGGYEPDQIRRAICKQTLIINNCFDELVLEMVRLDADDNNWSFPTTNATCLSRTEEVTPPTDFTPGAPNDTMYLRACMAVVPIFPWAGLSVGLTSDPAKGFNMIAQSAFAVEPI